MIVLDEIRVMSLLLAMFVADLPLVIRPSSRSAARAWLQGNRHGDGGDVADLLSDDHDHEPEQ